MRPAAGIRRIAAGIVSRLKDFRRTATRYDGLAQNLHAAVSIAAIICYWL